MDDGDEPTGPKDQWWRINYAATGDKPVTVEVSEPGLPGLSVLTSIENDYRKSARGREK